MTIGTIFMWTVILGLISVLCETNGQHELSIVFATLSGLGLLFTFWAVLEDI